MALLETSPATAPCNIPSVIQAKSPIFHLGNTCANITPEIIAIPPHAHQGNSDSTIIPLLPAAATVPTIFRHTSLLLLPLLPSTSGSPLLATIVATNSWTVVVPVT